MNLNLPKAALLSLLLIAPLAWAQPAVNVTATVDRNVMSVGDSFTYTVKVSSKESKTVGEPRLPNLSNLELINTWKASESRSSYSNGSFTVENSQNFNYMFVARQAGKTVIESSEVQVDGQVYKTKPISLTISANPVRQAQPRPRQRQRGADPLNDPFAEMEDMFSQLLRRRPRPNIKTQPGQPSEAFFIQVEVDKSKAYVGEQITASWYLYTRGQVLEIDTLKYPSLNGFWKEDIEIATRLNFVNEIINGIPYKKALLASYALFPIKAGTSKIDIYKAKCRVVTLPNFAFNRSQYYTKSSRPLDIQVLDVPAANQPKNFTGAVGRFQMTAKVDPGPVPTNEPITMTVRFDGEGNAKLIDLPAFDLPPSLELYDIKKESKFFKNGKSFKNFEILIIPREAGKVTIPSLSVSLFDPESEAFYEEKSQTFTVEVVPGKNDNNISSTPLAKGSIEEEKPQLPPLDLTVPSASFELPVPKVILWPFLFLIAFAVLVWRLFVEMGWGRKRQELDKLVKEKMRHIYASADKGEWRKVGVDMMNTVYMVLGEVSGMGGAAEEVEKILRKAPPSVRRQLKVPLVKLLQRFEALGFAPEAVVGELKEKKQLKKNIEEMEKILLKALSLGLGVGEESKSEEDEDRATGGGNTNVDNTKDKGRGPIAESTS